MENSQRVRSYLIAFTTLAVIHSAVSQRQLSGGSSAYSQYSQSPYTPQQQQQQPTQVQELCGIQDRDQLPDFHAAAPWAAALFYVEGDIFQSQIKPQYLSTAIFISRNLAITSGSKILSQQESGLQTKLQLFYGHRASGKQTLIRIRKVEPLSPPRQPLALKVESSPTSARILQNQERRGKSHENEELYLLHLESVIDITSFSRPLCTNQKIFDHKNQYSRDVGGTNKVHISGYAAKNETNATHVVFFTSDREWQIKSWDTDNINVMMRRQQLTYDFQPKNFNPGSALTVKINDQFFVVGILVRTSGAQTIFRSLEKFVEMIQSKELEYAPTPNPVINSGLPALYETKPTIVNPDNDRYNAYHQQNSNNQQASSPTDAQYAHLEKSEFEEKQQTHQSYGQINQQTGHSIDVGASNSNWGTSTRTTVRPSILTQRPDLQFNPQVQQSQHSYNQNPVHIDNGRRPQQQQQESSLQQTQKYSGRQTEPPYGQHPIYPTTSTTTARSQFPPYSQNQQYYDPHPQQQRPQPDSRQQQQPYYQQPPTIKCSHDYLEGVDIECLSRQKGTSAADCIKNAPMNTTIRLSCKPHYVPLDNYGEKIIEKTCDASGNWLPRKAFACKLDCGNVGKSVPYIVHGSKTVSEKWPWHAALFKKVNQTSYTYICGATLITRSILVTAAHCLHGRNPVTGSSTVADKSLFKVVVGAIDSNLLQNRRDSQTQEFDIKLIRVNEHYNPNNFEADIALVQIEKPVLLTDFVRPVCFPYPSNEENVSGYQLSEGNQGVVVGFGTTNEDWNISRTLRMAMLPVVSVKNCTNVLERQPSSTQYCAGYTNGTSVCEGDSGGAHIFSDQYSKRYYIQGVISHGNRKDSNVGRSRCDHEKYTVFTKVASFGEWVKSVVLDLDFDYNRRRRK